MAERPAGEDGVRYQVVQEEQCPLMLPDPPNYQAEAARIPRWTAPYLLVLVLPTDPVGEV